MPLLYCFLPVSSSSLPAPTTREVSRVSARGRGASCPSPLPLGLLGGDRAAPRREATAEQGKKELCPARGRREKVDSYATVETSTPVIQMLSTRHSLSLFCVLVGLFSSAGFLRYCNPHRVLSSNLRETEQRSRRFACCTQEKIATEVGRGMATVNEWLAFALPAGRRSIAFAEYGAPRGTAHSPAGAC